MHKKKKIIKVIIVKRKKKKYIKKKMKIKMKKESWIMKKKKILWSMRYMVTLIMENQKNKLILLKYKELLMVLNIHYLYLMKIWKKFIPYITKKN